LRLYHRTIYKFLPSIIYSFIILLIIGCTTPQVTQGLIAVTIRADKKEYQVNMPAGSTVQEILKSAQFSLGEMDRVEPPMYSVVSEGALINVIRVREEYYIEQQIIPFEHKEIRNEALPEGESRLSQPGVNGLEEITYHRVIENDVEVSKGIVKTVTLKEAIPEILMVGSKASAVSIVIPGRIAYLSAGNAWLIDNATSQRKMIVSTGDLDGRIFSLSKDGNFLLFTRYSSAENIINTLWAASLTTDPIRMIDLKVNNVVHFAEFDPSSKKIAYSTVEWRETAPGWQANNDLIENTVSTSGLIGTPKIDLEANSGGVYGWWGMDFYWSPDALHLLYSRPDGIGIVDTQDGSIKSTYVIETYQTGGNWAWAPGVSWSPDGNIIYMVDHIPVNSDSSKNQAQFDLLAIPLISGSPIHLVQDVGMFAYPVPSPVSRILDSINTSSENVLDQDSFLVAYLQAIFPDQSETSGYRLCIIDRDGSNRVSLFPEEGANGLDPQRIVWSPAPMADSGEYSIAFIYNGNIWIINSFNGVAQQITGDGLTSQIDWR